mgnify:CR=1 FL=1
MIAAGGGGIPTAYDSEGKLHGVEAVIDKDLASGLLAGVGLFAPEDAAAHTSNPARAMATAVRIPKGPVRVTVCPPGERLSPE